MHEPLNENFIKEFISSAMRRELKNKTETSRKITVETGDGKKYCILILGEHYEKN